MFSNLIYDYVKNSIYYNDSKIELPLDIMNQIKNSWEDYITQKPTSNGELFTIDSMHLKDKTLCFYVKKTSYDYYIYSMKNNFNGKYICHSLAANILPLTSDNYYVLGVMADWTSLANKIKFIGGALSKEDISGDVLEPIKCVIREANEELGIDICDKKYVLDFKPKYFVTRRNLSFINTLFFANLSISSNDVLQLFAQYTKDLQNENQAAELSSIFLVENQPEEIKSFIENNKDRLIDYMEELFLVLIGEMNVKNIIKEKSIIKE